MSSEIRCTFRDYNGTDCDKLLGVIDGLTLEIFCPRCKRKHVLSILEIAHIMSTYLEGIEAKAGQAAGGKGFLL